MSNAYDWVTFPVQIALVPLIAWWARRKAGASVAWTVGIAAILVAWEALAVGLASAGAFQPRPGAPPIIGIMVVAPLVLGAWALSRRDVRAPLGALPWLIGLQVLRVEGFQFVVASRTGLLPAHFGEPAGWGDAFIGVTAPLVALAVARQWRGWRGVAAAWNLVGIADLANAVGLGLLSAPGMFQVFHAGPTTAPMTQLPLSLVPTFGVPLAVLGHLLALRSLRGPAAHSPRALVPGAAS